MTAVTARRDNSDNHYHDDGMHEVVSCLRVDALANQVCTSLAKVAADSILQGRERRQSQE